MKKNTGSANTPSFRWKTSKNPSAHGSTETYFAVTVIDRETGRNRYPGSDIKTVSRNPASGKHNPPVTKNAIFIFIPTKADFISSSPASVATKPLTGKAKKPAAFPQKREKTFSDSKKPRISRLRPAVPPASGDFPISPRFFPPEQKRISPCRQKPA